ncbi:MAG: LamG-like jellyroll fold domain-containing protein [Patescibacteria group bacterium]
MQSLRGFSLVEVLVAIGIFVAVAISFFGATVIAFDAASQAGDKIEAAFLLEEGVEAVKFMRDSSWLTNIAPQDIFYEQCLRVENTTPPAAPGVQFTTKPVGLKFLMHMDATGGTATVASDSSGGNHHGIIHPSVIVNGTFVGPRYTAFNFNGVQSIEIPAHTDFTNLGSFTVSAWVKTANAGSGLRRIVSQQFLTNYWYLGLRDNIIEFGSSNDALQITKGSAISSNPPVWHHVAVIRDIASPSKKLYWYLDGVLIGSEDISSTAVYNMSTAQIFIGGRNFVGNNCTLNCYNGDLDEVSLYDRALSSLEIELLAKHNIPACGSELGSFIRSVRFTNVCRTESAQSIHGIAYAVDDIVGTTTATTLGDNLCGFPGALANSTTLDLDTKYARVRTAWKRKDKFFEEATEFYFANLFSESNGNN